MHLLFDCEKSAKPTAAPHLPQPVIELHLRVEFKYIDAETRIKASLQEPIYWMTNAKISADALLTQINEIELNENKTVNNKKLILQRMYEEYINELNNLFDKWNALRLIDQLDDD